MRKVLIAGIVLIVSFGFAQTKTTTLSGVTTFKVDELKASASVKPSLDHTVALVIRRFQLLHEENDLYRRMILDMAKSCPEAAKATEKYNKEMDALQKRDDDLYKSEKAGTR